MLHGVRRALIARGRALIATIYQVAADDEAPHGAAVAAIRAVALHRHPPVVARQRHVVKHGETILPDARVRPIHDDTDREHGIDRGRLTHGECRPAPTELDTLRRLKLHRESRGQPVGRCVVRAVAGAAETREGTSIRVEPSLELERRDERDRTETQNDPPPTVACARRPCKR